MALPLLATLVLLAGLLTECVGAAAASHHHPASTTPSPAHTAAHSLDDAAAHPCAPHPAHCVEKALAPRRPARSDGHTGGRPGRG
ncbi:hypothetical protein [Nocardia farcinica]|uniref:hypothetical protein n=1 Tax=Nocardia farcinica TaxID=37329 RepID=UPI001115A425|nr:hypothetical protein [Nocardia farcinica]